MFHSRIIGAKSANLDLHFFSENTLRFLLAKNAAGCDVSVIEGAMGFYDGAEVHIVYRRGEEELPARKEEVHHAKEEGIIFDLLQNPTEILVDENGWVKGVRVIKMELGEPDASGRRSPVEIPGSEYEMDCDTVIMSLGTSPNPLISSTTAGLETNRRISATFIRCICFLCSSSSSCA